VRRSAVNVERTFLSEPHELFAHGLIKGRNEIIRSRQVGDSFGPTASFEYSDLLLPSGISARSNQIKPPDRFGRGADLDTYSPGTRPIWRPNRLQDVHNFLQTPLFQRHIVSFDVHDKQELPHDGFPMSSFGLRFNWQYY